MVKIIRTLLLRLILENAIVFEEKAYNFYDKAEKKVSSEDVKELLRKLKAEELKHRLRMEEAQRKADISVCCSIDSEKEGTVEAMSDDWPAITEESKREDILRVAYKKELQAKQFYATMKERFPGSFARDIFAALESEEEKHARWLSSQME
jgi:rubrerythrin